MAKLILCVCFWFMAACVAQAQTWLSMGGASVHFCRTCGYNNFNPGIGLQHSISQDLRLLGGVYYNSYYKVTTYGGLGYQPIKYGVFKFGILGGVVSNYDNLNIPIIALPALSIEGERFGIDILGFPSVGSRTGLLTANFKYKL